MESLLSGAAKGAVEAARGVYQDYQSGRNLRLGQYKGSESVKKLGHYNANGKRLGIYHA